MDYRNKVNKIRKVFIDTSGWIAIVAKTDSLNAKATQIYKELLETEVEFVTHQGILLEVGNSLSSENLRKIALGLKQNIEDSPRIKSVELDQELYNAGWELFEQRADKDWGIIDCINFVVMQENDITEAVTADKHFEQTGFTELL